MNLARIILTRVMVVTLIAQLGFADMASNDRSHHPHHDKLVDADGQWKYTNALKDATSPYLLQHAHNPVDWHPWGEAAFALARKENKPIFLSIGYSTCYWCHVMERQVFENPVIAAQMNAHFVNIKVDREERPDLDEIYMTATQLTTGRGGWPMSVFLVPGEAGEQGLKPFFAGTYFPPEPMHGMPSFPQVLEHINKLWEDDREKVLETSDKLAEAVMDQLGQHHEPGDLDAKLIQVALDTLLRTYDEEHGGFGGAPKFPTPSQLVFLMYVYRNNANDALWQTIGHTLDRMARGGMYDQIGGGFHRYSVDEKWLVPHFEKMLYDNGQLISLYAEAHVANPPKDDPLFYKHVAMDIARYIKRDMIDETGAFLSAQDAEVNAREGGNYVWTSEEVKTAIDDEALAELALEIYGLNQGANFTDPHDAEAKPVNVLYLPRPLHEVAAEKGVELDVLLEQVKAIDAQLLAARDLRDQPSTDDKVLTSWNGLMIAGLAKAGRLLDEPGMVAMAERAAQAIVDHMTVADGQGRLYRTMRDGEAHTPAFLEDYAFFIQGLIELWIATGDDVWLNRAKVYTAIVVQDFATEQGGYYDTLANQPDLFVRTRGFHDGAVPSGNSVMIHNLLTLYEHTNDGMFLRQAIRDLRSFTSVLDRYAPAVLNLQAALLRAMELSGQQAEAAGELVKHEHLSVTSDNVAVGDDGTTLTATLTFTVTDGVHINANEPGITGVQPLDLDMIDGEGFALSVQFPKGEAKPFGFSEENVTVFEGTFKVTVTLQLKDAEQGTPWPDVGLMYQACDDRMCFEPKAARLRFKP